VEYFKHYTNARHAESLANLRVAYGFDTYGRYWTLLEFLGENFDGEHTTFRYHRQTIRELLRVQSWNKLRLIAERLSTVRGLTLKQIENVFEIEAPILLDLMSRDFKRARKDREETAPKNKIKIKNKIKDKEGEVTALSAPHPLIELWNFNCQNLPQVKKVSKARLKKMQALWKEHEPEELLQAIAKIAASDFCNGKNDRGWVATFDFLLQPDTPAKALEGKYDNRASAKLQGTFKNNHLVDWANTPEGKGA